MLQDVLREMRERARLKQSEVAEYVGVTPQTYMKWENGKNEPKASNLKKLAEILNVSEVELCRGERFSQDDDPLSFMTKVSRYSDFIDDVTFAFTLFKFVQNKDEFLKQLDNELKKMQGFNIEDIDQMRDEELYGAAMYKKHMDDNFKG